MYTLDRHLLKITVRLSLFLMKQNALEMFAGLEVKLHEFIIPELDGIDWSASCLGRFFAGDGATGAHWMGPRAARTLQKIEESLAAPRNPKRFISVLVQRTVDIATEQSRLLLKTEYA
jgi:hypothetical protein